ncbi:MAG: M64 family metallopeptidase [Myxococcota bacterium]
MIALLAGCSAPELAPTGRPTVADAQVLLARIGDVVTVEGVLAGPQTVDIDAGGDERYGFRYRIYDADDALLYERSTVGPALVESFLAYWSGVSGVDILDSLPSLGEFPIQVPILPDAAWIAFEVRDPGTGAYTLRGGWDPTLADAMSVTPAGAEVLSTAVLHDGGDPARAVDLVILPDGYRAEDLAQFRADADAAAATLLGAEPYTSYADRIGITRVDVASNEAGASFDCPTCGVVDTAFGSIFPIELVNRFSGAGYEARAIFQAQQWKIAHTLADIPWDAVLVLVNSPQFGGMAVHYAVVTRGVGDLPETSVHELGHAFGMLGDEYVADDCIRTAELGLPENITDRPDDPPWRDHVAPGTPLPTPRGAGHAVGAYQGAWNCDDLYKPAETCRMDESGDPFCAVCAELLVRRLFRFGDPADAVAIDGRDVVVSGLTPGSTVSVRADGVALDGTRLPRGAREVTVEVAHQSDQVVSDPTGDLRETWTFGAPLAD